MKLSVIKIRVISFSTKTNVLIYDFRICQSSVTRTDFVRDLGVFIDAKLHFHDHINYIFSHCIKLLSIVGSITSNLSSLECILRLYITLVRSKLEYASVVWNSITSADANKLESVQQRFAALCFNSFFPKVHYCYSRALEELKLLTLSVRRHRLDALFPTQVYSGFKFCPSDLEIAGLWVPARYIRDFTLFSACSSCNSCLSARCASAANVVCRDGDVLSARSVHLNYVL
jgi:hypothetical protein